MERMHGNIERFEVIGRGVLNMALRSQPSNGSSSQPQTSFNPPPLNQHAPQKQTSSNSQKTYRPNVAQPPMTFAPSSPPPQPEPYSEFDYTLDFGSLDAS